MEQFIISALAITIIVDGLLLVYLYGQRHQDTLMTLLLLHLTSILLWTIGILCTIVMCSDPQSNCLKIIGEIPFAAAFAMAVTKYYFVQEFIMSHRKTPRGWRYYWILLPALFVCIGSFVPGLYYSDLQVINGYYITSTPGPGAGLYMIAIMYFLIHPIILLARSFRDKNFTERARAQMKLLLFGISFFFAASLTTNLVLPVIFDFYLLNGLGPTFSVVLAAFIWYTIYKYNFLEIRILVQRGLIYTILFSFVALLFLVVVHLVGALFPYDSYSSDHYMNQLIGGVIATALGVFCVPKLDSFLRRVTDPIFFKDTYSYTTALHDLSVNVNKNIRLREIRRTTAHSLQSLLRAEYVQITPMVSTTSYIAPTQAPSQKIVMPIVNDDRIIGLITIGPKRSGENYTGRDLSLIQTFSYQIAIAFEKARLYKEVEDYSRELEERVEERTTEIQKLHADRDRIMLEISHGLQTPLTVVKNELYTLQTEHPDSKELAAFERSIDCISQLIYNLLHLAELDAANAPHEECNLTELLGELADYYSVVCAGSNVTFTSTLTPNVLAHGNRQLLEEVLTNLVSNSMKYMKPESSGAERKISVALIETDNITITVTDTGIGIAQNDIPKLFDKFYRIKHTGQQNKTGAGLGLSICQKIVELHKGTITVASTLGEGTAFTITLPKL